MSTKVCRICKLELPLDSFGKRRAEKDGIHYACRSCVKIANAKYNEQHRKEVNDKARERSRTLAAKRKAKRYYKENKSAYAERRKKWKEANPEKEKAVTAASRARHPETVRRNRQNRRSRMIMLNVGDVTKEALQELYASWTGVCPLCELESKPTLDHKIPLSRGGLHTMDNLWLICIKCNTSKNNRTVEEHLERATRRPGGVTKRTVRRRTP